MAVAHLQLQLNFSIGTLETMVFAEHMYSSGEYSFINQHPLQCHDMLMMHCWTSSTVMLADGSFPLRAYSTINLYEFSLVRSVGLVCTHGTEKVTV